MQYLCNHLTLIQKLLSHEKDLDKEVHQVFLVKVMLVSFDSIEQDLYVPYFRYQMLSSQWFEVKTLFSNMFFGGCHDNTT